MKSAIVYGFIWLTFEFQLQIVWSANVLGLFTTPFQSQLILPMHLMRSLASKGHSVTTVTTHSDDVIDSENYRSLIVPDIESDAWFGHFRSKIFQRAETNDHLLFEIPDFIDSVLKRSNHTLQSRLMQRLLATESYDLVILGWMANDIELGVAAHFKCPSIVLGSMHAVKPLRSIVGNPSDWTHVSSDYLGYVGYSMTFWQRIKNAGVSIIEQLSLTALSYIKHEKYYRENFPATQGYPSLDELRRNVTLVLVNYHFSQGNIRAYVPGMIEIGGLHLHENPLELTKEIKAFLDGAHDGAIIFSFGSYLQTTDMSLEKQNSIIKAFKKLKQRVLIKWAGPINDMPENVLALKWLPNQQDIIAHKNVRILITHGGANSLIEARYHGVPILGIAIFGDQQANINMLVDDGTGLEVQYYNLDEFRVENAINLLLNNAAYAERAHHFACIFKNRPVSALHLATFWVEYVIYYRGARHLQSPAAHMGFLTFYSLDVIGMAIFMLLRMFMTYKGVRFAYRKLQLWRVNRHNSKEKKE